MWDWEKQWIQWLWDFQWRKRTAQQTETVACRQSCSSSFCSCLGRGGTSVELLDMQEKLRCRGIIDGNPRCVGNGERRFGYGDGILPMAWEPVCCSGSGWLGEGSVIWRRGVGECDFHWFWRWVLSHIIPRFLASGDTWVQASRWQASFSTDPWTFGASFIATKKGEAWLYLHIKWGAPLADNSAADCHVANPAEKSSRFLCSRIDTWLFMQALHFATICVWLFPIFSLRSWKYCQRGLLHPILSELQQWWCQTAYMKILESFWQTLQKSGLMAPS